MRSRPGSWPRSRKRPAALALTRPALPGAAFFWRAGNQLAVAPGIADLAGATRRRGFATGAAADSSVSAPIFCNAASAARSPLSQAPSTVPHRVSWVASPPENMQPIGSVKTLRDAARRARRRTWRPAQTARHSSGSRWIYRPQRPIRCRTIWSTIPPRTPPWRGSPSLERSRPNEPATSIEHSDDGPILANNSAVRVELLCSMTMSSRTSPSGFAWQLQHDAIVAAEVQFCRGIELAPWEYPA